MVHSFSSDASLIAPPVGKIGWPWTLPASKGCGARSHGTRWPRITVITPSYNQPQFIEETIRSVLLQGYPNLEYMIIDGGSGSSTIEVIEKYLKWLDYFSSGPDRGQSDAINRGLGQSTGDLLVWLNSDDVLLPGSLEAVAIAASDYSEALVVAGKSEYRDVSGTQILFDAIRIPRTHSDLFKFGCGYFFPQPSTFFTRNAFLQAGKLDEGLHYAMDLDLWFRLLKCSRVVIVDELISWMRQHDDAKTSRDTFCSLNEVDRVFARYQDLVPPAAFIAGLRSMRLRRAEVCVKKGMHALRDGDRGAAITAALLAVRSRGRVALSRGWLSLVARILFNSRPKSMR
jgi:glycosyltransferase involved in cell wall biosynthesis